MNHDNRTQQGPSLALIAATGAANAASIAGTVYGITGTSIGGQEVVSTLMGLGLTACLSARVLYLTAERAVSKDRARREEEYARAERQRERMRRASDTATWDVPSVGQRLTVRWDPLEGCYYVRGWLGDSWVMTEETVWHGADALAHTLVEREYTRLIMPWDNQGTRTVRARLNLPNWSDPDPEPEPSPEFVPVVQGHQDQRYSQNDMDRATDVLLRIKASIESDPDTTQVVPIVDPDATQVVPIVDPDATQIMSAIDEDVADHPRS